MENFFNYNSTLDRRDYVLSAKEAEKLVKSAAYKRRVAELRAAGKSRRAALRQAGLEAAPTMAAPEAAQVRTERRVMARFLQDDPSPSPERMARYLQIAQSSGKAARTRAEKEGQWTTRMSDNWHAAANEYQTTAAGNEPLRRTIAGNGRKNVVVVDGIIPATTKRGLSGAPVPHLVQSKALPALRLADSAAGFTAEKAMENRQVMPEYLPKMAISLEYLDFFITPRWYGGTAWRDRPQDIAAMLAFTS